MKILENVSILLREAILNEYIMLQSGSNQEKTYKNEFAHRQSSLIRIYILILDQTIREKLQPQKTDSNLAILYSLINGKQSILVIFKFIRIKFISRTMQLDQDGDTRINWKLSVCIIVLAMIKSCFEKSDNPATNTWLYGEIDKKFEGTWKKTPGKQNEGLTKNSGTFSMEFNYDSYEMYIVTLVLKNGQYSDDGEAKAEIKIYTDEWKMKQKNSSFSYVRKNNKWVQEMPIYMRYEYSHLISTVKKETSPAQLQFVLSKRMKVKKILVKSQYLSATLRVNQISTKFPWIREFVDSILYYILMFSLLLTTQGCSRSVSQQFLKFYSPLTYQMIILGDFLSGMFLCNKFSSVFPLYLYLTLNILLVIKNNLNRQMKGVLIFGLFGINYLIAKILLWLFATHNIIFWINCLALFPQIYKNRIQNNSCYLSINLPITIGIRFLVFLYIRSIYMFQPSTFQIVVFALIYALQIKVLRIQNLNSEQKKAEHIQELFPNNFIPEEKKECSICLRNSQSHENESKIHIVTQCGHVFHKQCIKNWVSRNPTCPLCRRIIE